MRYLSRILGIGLCALLSQTPSGAQRHPKSARVSTSNIHALIQAIQDEIYANHLQAAGYGAEVPRAEDSYQLQLYVQPDFNQQGLAWAIYRLMPYGEVVRMFWIRPDGVAVLDGDIQNGFPPTEPSYLTACMSSEQLTLEKQSWMKSSIVIEPHPSRQRLHEASERQTERFGNSRGEIPAGHRADPTAWTDSKRAARNASPQPDPTGGATHYLLDYGQPLPTWAAGARPVKTFGPFLKTLGSQKVGKDVKVQIKIFP